MNELHSKRAGDKVYKPFMVEYESGSTQVFETTGQLARQLNVTGRTIVNWLQHKLKAYINYGITKIEYI